MVDRLAMLTAVARSAHGVDDGAEYLGRVCESIADHVGFARTSIGRYSAKTGHVEPLAAHGLSCGSPGLLGADEQSILRQARAGRSLVLVPNRSCAGEGRGKQGPEAAVVVVPLFGGAACLGFLAADHDGAPFTLDAEERQLLTTLGAIVAALLEQAMAHDDLVNALRLESEFIALASHELRTPAAAVCGAATTLHARGGSLSVAGEQSLLNVLHEQAERLRALVEQLLDLSRLEATSIRIRPVALAVRDRTEQIVREVAGLRRRQIEIRIDPTLRARADPDAFDRIVSNLVTNAFRYGRPPITVSAAVNDRHFRLAVEDRGPGVPGDFAPHLFDRFSRADGPGGLGAGLGLSIAQAYAHAHGGQLVYLDATPQGAHFELVLPVHPPAADEPGSPVFASGQKVWLDGRGACFSYTTPSGGGAVIRYDGETDTRVVPLRKLAAIPPLTG